MNLYIYKILLCDFSNLGSVLLNDLWKKMLSTSRCNFLDMVFVQNSLRYLNIMACDSIYDAFVFMIYM